MGKPRHARTRACKTALRPTPLQARRRAPHGGCQRWAHNRHPAALQTALGTLSEGGQWPSMASLSRPLRRARPAWALDLSQNPFDNGRRHLEDALHRYLTATRCRSTKTTSTRSPTATPWGVWSWPCTLRSRHRRMLRASTRSPVSKQAEFRRRCSSRTETRCLGSQHTGQVGRAAAARRASLEGDGRAPAGRVPLPLHAPTGHGPTWRA